MAALPLSQSFIYDTAKQIQTALTNVNCAHTRKDGSVQSVVFRRILVTESGLSLIYELDTQQIPHGVYADELTSKRTTHHLSSVIHHPVYAMNTTGVIYVVLLGEPRNQSKLPQEAYLRDVLDQHPGTSLTFPIGEGPSGPVWTRLAGHFLVGGETGSGKTSWIFSTVLALAKTNTPQVLQIVIVDPKAVDFTPLAGLAHLAKPIACEVEEAEELVAWLAVQMDERRRCFLQVIARDLDGYNARATEKLPYILAVIDEVTDLALRAGVKSRLYKELIRLASAGRAFGINLLLATQNPKAEVLNTLIRGNLASRIAFRVTTSEHSRAILGVAGAEKLPRIPGRMVARLGDGQLHELQAYRVTEEELAALGPADPASLLDAETKAMMQYAVDHLERRFPQTELMAAGWTRTQYRQAVVRLGQAGMLQRGEKNSLHLV